MGQQGINDFKYPGLTVPQRFDISKFNREFETSKESNKLIVKLKENERLDRINKKDNELKPYQLPVSDILINIKDTWFNILDDLLQGKIMISILTDNNRLFYIGLTIIIVIIILYLYDIIMADSKTDNNASQKLIEIHYIYSN